MFSLQLHAYHLFNVHLNICKPAFLKLQTVEKDGRRVKLEAK